MTPRTYQTRCLNQLYQWWMQHQSITDTPLIVMPTGSGKSVCIAELVRLMFDTWPEEHPRTLVIVPSKELAEQNGEKLAKMLPSHLRVGYYSASLGKKDATADIIVSTIGSIAKKAHLLGNIKLVIVDEAHLISTEGKEVGRYRQLLTDLAKYCTFRVVGFTATPFRGNGVWLTAGDDPLFNGVAAKVSIQELLDAGYIAPLVRPIDVIESRIDTAAVTTSSGDYNLKELDERVMARIEGIAAEAQRLAADRKKWIAFTPTIITAHRLAELLPMAAVVTGETPKKEREELINQFRAGDLRCLVTVLALATGFDVPDVDCIIWCRPTISPVLYVQGAGRGMRIADGKENCLWLDFSDTTDRMGPIDTITGRDKKRKDDEAKAPFRLCENCGEHIIPASLLVCPTCGHEHKPPADDKPVEASESAVLSYQIKPRINDYPVSDVFYSIHNKPGRPASLRVDYLSGFRQVASEWVCFQHEGFARGKAELWWMKRSQHNIPMTCETALQNASTLKKPLSIRVNESGRYPEIIAYKWEQAA